MDTTYLPPETRQEDEIHLREVWNLLVRNAGLIFLVLILVVAGAAAYTFTALPVYRSEVTIRIDEQKSDVPVLDILRSLSTGSQVATEMEVLRSRTLAEGVVQELGLQLSVVRPRGVARVAILNQIHVEPWAPKASYRLTRRNDGEYTVADAATGALLGTVSVTRPAVVPGATFTLQPGSLDYEEIEVAVGPFESTVAGLRSALTVTRPNREAGIVVVRYESADTQLVHLVLNTLARRFIAQRQEVQKTEARSTVAFLQEQLDTLRVQLTAAEEALQTFREQGQVVSLEAEASAQVTQLARLQADRNQLDAERAALQQLVDEIEREAARADPDQPSPYRRLISFPSLLTNQAASELLRSLNALDQQKGELLQRRTLEDPDVVNLSSRIRDLERQLRSVALTYLQGLANQVRSLDQTLARFGRELERIPGKEIQQIRLQRQRQVLEEIYTLLQTRLQEARIAQAVEDPTVRVVDPAVLPPHPVKPRKALTLALALVLGGMLGVGVAFGKEQLDDTVHTKEDIQLASGGAPVLGLIPRIRVAGNGNGRWQARRKAQEAGGSSSLDLLEGRLVTGRDPRNPTSEAYRTLRTNITFANPDRPAKTLVFTSPTPQDGKTTTCANLAITLAQQGSRVVLVDADMRRGVLHSVFAKERTPGLSDLLLGRAALEEVLQTVDLGESGVLDFIATGTLPPNPAELLGSRRMREFLEKAEGLYELVILDSPPLAVVTDAAVLGTQADGVVLVARASTTEKGAIAYSVEQLRNVRARILGAVLNDVDFRRDGRYYSSYGRYGYYYHYYYGDDQKGRRKKGSAKV